MSELVGELISHGHQWGHVKMRDPLLEWPASAIEYCVLCGQTRDAVEAQNRITALERRNAHLLDRNVAAMHVVYLAAGMDVISERAGTSLVSSDVIERIQTQARALLAGEQSDGA